MSKVYDSIMKGLEEAVAHADRKLNCRVDRVRIDPVRAFTGSEVKQIRQSVSMTQELFAGYLGVSRKTVEAWEAGQNHPNGAASRLLTIIEREPETVSKFDFAKVERL